MQEPVRRYFIKTLENTKHKRWCEKHPTGFWGVNPITGELYARCSQGFRFREICIARED